MRARVRGHVKMSQMRLVRAIKSKWNPLEPDTDLLKVILPLLYVLFM